MFKLVYRNLSKGVFLFLLSLVLSISTFATEITQTSNDILQAIDEASLSKETYVPEASNDDTDTYAHVISAYIQPDEDGITVSVTNIGNDALDSVRVRVIAKGKSSTIKAQNTQNDKSTSTVRIPILQTKDFRISFPMTRTTMEYVVFVDVYEEGKYITLLSKNANLEFKESSLTEWNPGTMSSCRETVDYHFYKHGDEIGAKNLPQYLRSASAYKTNLEKAILNFTAMNLYKITTGTGPIPSTKYTLYGASRYLLWANSDHSILTYGGNL